jgi:hypothetical protein
MKVLIWVDPHKASVASAVVDEALGELLERASRRTATAPAASIPGAFRPRFVRQTAYGGAFRKRAAVGYVRRTS